LTDFLIWGAMGLKAARKFVDEIDPILRYKIERKCLVTPNLTLKHEFKKAFK